MNHLDAGENLYRWQFYKGWENNTNKTAKQVINNAWQRLHQTVVQLSRTLGCKEGSPA